MTKCQLALISGASARFDTELGGIGDTWQAVLILRHPDEIIAN
jgi:hypothetical protein